VFFLHGLRQRAASLDARLRRGDRAIAIVPGGKRHFTLGGVMIWDLPFGCSLRQTVGSRSRQLSYFEVRRV
jgi:hypothetical protein